MELSRETSVRAASRDAGTRPSRQAIPRTDGAIRVLIVDDHPLMCLGIRRALRGARDIEVVAETHNGDDALAMIEELAPDVVLLDFALPDTDAVGVMYEARRRGSRSAMVVLTCRSDEQCVRAAIDGGAVGFLTKTSVGPATLSGAIRDAHTAGGTVSPDVVGSLVRAARHTTAADPGHLTERELEIWHLVADGLSNREIATQLGLSERTVKFHVGNVLRKTQTRCRAEATALAFRQGIMDDFA